MDSSQVIPLVFLLLFAAVILLGRWIWRAKSETSALRIEPLSQVEDRQAEQRPVVSSRPELPPCQEKEDRSRRRALSKRRSKIPASASSTPKRSRKSRLVPHRQFVVIDLETTGLSSAKHEIIEIGAVKVNVDAETRHTFQTFVKAKRRLPKKITAMTGITQEIVDLQGVPLDQAMERLVQFVEDLPLVAYNASFDMGFLAAAAAKCGRPFDCEFTCALQLARKAWPGLESYRLSDVARLRKLDMSDEHRSLGDCTRTADIYFNAASKLSS